MPDSVRAFGAKAQTAIGTPTAPTAGFNFVEGKVWTPNIGSRIPKYKTNARLQERRIHITTRRDEINLQQVGLDLYDFPILLQSGFGPPTLGVYKLGTATNATPTAFLTAKVVPWGGAESWQFQDGRVNTMEISGDAEAGTIQYGAMLLAILSASQPGSAWAPTYSLPAGAEPFDAWQVSVTKGGVSPGCLMNFRFSINNNFNPLYCFPSVAPGAGTTAGLAPTRYRDGDAEARFNATIEYQGYAPSGVASAFKDFLTKTPGDWVLTFTDPTLPGSLAIELPNMEWTSGSIDESNPESRQVLQGVGLYSDSAATSVVATVVVP